MSLKKGNRLSGMWTSPISYEAKEFAKLIRESLESLRYVFVRDHTKKMYDRFVVIIPMVGGAHVYRYTVEYPSQFVVRTYDTHPNTKAGLVPILEIDPVNEKNIEHVKRLLSEIVSRVERPPWEFTAAQRLMVGYFLPEFRKARKAWAKFGFDTSIRRRSRNRIKKRKRVKENTGTGKEEGKETSGE